MSWEASREANNLQDLQDFAKQEKKKVRNYDLWIMIYELRGEPRSGIIYKIYRFRERSEQEKESDEWWMMSDEFF